MKIYNLVGKLIYNGPISELKEANLQGANLDLSYLPLSCRGTKMKDLSIN